VSIRVAIADDHALVRAGFRALIEAEPGLEVVGEAADGAEAIELARTAEPDVSLMDIRMPGTDGAAATGQITSREVTGRPALALWREGCPTPRSRPSCSQRWQRSRPTSAGC
jgi:DNA-binding NarL/FixJ family response regulator